MDCRVAGSQRRFTQRYFGRWGDFCHHRRSCIAATAICSDWEWLVWLAAAAMIQLRLQCNLYDGMVAIATGRASPVGEIYNDVPDRISDSALFIGAGYAVGSNPTLGYVAALAAMFTAYVRAVGKAGGAKQEFCGPMAKQHRMALLTVAAGYCAFTAEGLAADVASIPSLWRTCHHIVSDCAGKRCHCCAASAANRKAVSGARPMKPDSFSRLFDPRTSLDDPITLWITVGLAIALPFIPFVIWLSLATGKLSAKLHGELMLRDHGWLLIIPLLVGPILLGAL